VVPISDTNFTGTDPTRFEVINAACSHLAKAGLIDWTPALGQQPGTTLGFAHITGPGVDVFEGHTTPPINIKIPGSEKPPRIATSESAADYGSGGYGSETYGGAPPKGAEDILAPVYATPFEIGVESELTAERQRFSNEWLFKWHALGHGGSVDVDAFDGRRIHYGGIKFGSQQQSVFWQAIGRYLNMSIHEYFKRWETETVNYENQVRRQSLDQLERKLRAFTAEIISLSTSTVRRLRTNGSFQSVSAFDSAGHNTQAINEIVRLAAAHRQLLEQFEAASSRPSAQPEAGLSGVRVTVNPIAAQTTTAPQEVRSNTTQHASAALSVVTEITGHATGDSTAKAIGIALRQNRDAIDLATVSLLILIDEKLSALREQRLNSPEAQAAITTYEDIRHKLATLREVASKPLDVPAEEEAVAKSAISFMEALGNFWNKRHVEVFDMGLFLGGLAICSSLNASGVVVAGICGVMVGGQRIADVIIEIARGANSKNK
jgi:hypothetical protein